MIVKRIQNLKSGMEKMQESINTFNKELEEINIETEMNNTIAEIKNIIEGINSRITEAEEWISQLEDRMVEITAEEKNKGKGMKRIEKNFRDLWDHIEHTKYSSCRGPRRRR